jgi:Flp pilus assembly protein TadB
VEQILIIVVASAIAFLWAIAIREGWSFTQRFAAKAAKEWNENEKRLDRLQAKDITLRKKGVDYFLIKDNFSCEKWYEYKALSALIGAIILFGGMSVSVSRTAAIPAGVVGAVVGWFMLDIILNAENKSSNDKMLSDIMEVSRSILYGNRSGQYIADSLKNACTIVENDRLKTTLIQMRIHLESGANLRDALSELASHFDNPEIDALCTVIRSLQETGQANDALDTLKENVQREQKTVNEASVNHIRSKMQMACFACFTGSIIGFMYIMIQFLQNAMTEF